MGRFVVKLGSNIVAEDDGSLRADVLAHICAEIAERHAAGDDVVIVTSGAIARGIEVMGLRGRPGTIDALQAASAVGQGKLYRAYDELLRYDAPVQFSRRITVAPLEVAGRTIPAGTFVLAGLASSNRDHDFWGPTADELALARANAGQHVSFGSGTHFCLGAALARLEGQVAVGRLIRRFPDLALADPGPTWNGRMNLRGLERLPLTFTP